jgi:hypothetical protein
MDISETYTIPEQDYLMWAASEDAQTAIAAGDLTVNDGVDDLDIARGKDYIKFQTRAFYMRFDAEPERSNDFTSKNVQEAIEEVRDSVAGKIVEWSFASNGSTANKWMNNGHPSIASNDVPFVSPWTGSIIGLTFSNDIDTTDTDLEIYINGTLAYTWDIRSKRTAWIISTGGLASVAQGDRLSVFARKAGTKDPRNIGGQILAQLLPFSNGEGGTATGV